jgi:hypothetical protein
MEWTAAMNQLTCQKAIHVRSGRTRRGLKKVVKKIKLNNILCSVNFLMMCSVVKSTPLCYVTWLCSILFGAYCTRPATLSSIKLLITDSLRDYISHTSHNWKRPSDLCTSYEITIRGNGESLAHHTHRIYYATEIMYIRLLLHWIKHTLY